MNELLQNGFLWVLTNSWHASILAGLILFIQVALGGKLSASARHGLWLLVVVRLLWPFTIETPVSLFNYVSVDWILANHSSNAPVKVDPSTTSGHVDHPNPSTESPAVNNMPEEILAPTAVPEIRSQTDGMTWAAYTWLAGVLLLLGRELRVNGRFYLHLRNLASIADTELNEALQEGARQIGLKRVPVVKETQRIGTPAVCGVWRLQLLLPAELCGRLSAETLRYVLLHELAHLKRKDLAVNWLLHMLQILHWFNPAVWWAFHRLRTEREPAADELVLRRLEPGENIRYGQAIVQLLESFGRPASHSGLVGMGTAKQQMKRRIQMIADYKSNPKRQGWAVLAGLCLAVATLTAGQNETRSDNEATDDNPQRERRGIDGTGIQENRSAEPESLTTARIELTSKFIKLTPEAAGQLGLEWMFPNEQKPNSPRQATDETSEIRESLPGMALANFTLILPPEQAAAWHNAMQEQTGVEALAAPQITTLNQKEAEISVDMNKQVVTGVDDSAEKVLYRTEDIPTGPRLKVLPVIHTDRYTVELQVDAELLEFDRYLAAGNGKSETGLTYKIPKPQMRSRRMRTSAVMHPGQTLVLSGGWIRNASESEEDGDVEASNQLERLIVMMKLELTGTDGNPLFEEDNLPFDPGVVPYQATTELVNSRTED